MSKETIDFATFLENKTRIGNTMALFGGSFVNALGNALKYADIENSLKLYETYPELITRYWKIFLEKEEGEENEK